MWDFASDNHAGAHPAVLRALEEANYGPAPSYGDDRWSQRAQEAIQHCFGTHARAVFVPTGTGANAVAIACCVRPYGAILAADASHAMVDECAAPDHLSGAKLIGLRSSPNGKICYASIAHALARVGDRHASQPGLVSLTQPTERGVVYASSEVQAIADLAHAHGLFVHMDGARLANAAAYYNCSLRALTLDLGVDVVSFGLTKNGAVAAEAIVYFSEELYRHAPFVQKQAGLLLSKSRFLAAQVVALLESELWLSNATHANAMATRLATQLCGITGIRIVNPVHTNAIFAEAPPHAIALLQRTYPFYVWDAEENLARWMTSFETTEKDVDTFADAVRTAVA